MRFRMGLLIGFGAGYVLGTKAGRERYEQIVEATKAFRENPGVQRFSEEFGKTVAAGRERVTEVTNRRVEQAGTNLADQASRAKRLVSKGEDGEPAATPEAKPSSPSRQ